MSRPRLIWDNGKPTCLPTWAREEIVRSRLAIGDAVNALIDGNAEKAAQALGASDMVVRGVARAAGKQA